MESRLALLIHVASLDVVVVIEAWVNSCCVVAESRSMAPGRVVEQDENR